MRTIEVALRGEGIDVETATTDDDGPRRRIHIPLGERVIVEDAKRRYFAKTTDRYKISASFGRWIMRHARDYDVVHVHALFTFTSNIACFAARRAGVPYVVRPLGVLNTWGMQSRRPLLKRVSVALIERRLLAGAAAVQFTSENEYREALQWNAPVRGVVIPLAVSLPVTPPSDTLRKTYLGIEPGPVVLYLSRLDRKKNVEGLLQAWAICRRELRDGVLMIAGEGDAAYVGELKRVSHALGVAGAVRWIGNVDGPEKAEAFAVSSVFVLPSFSENFGLAPIEAMAAGLPVVVTRGVATAADIDAAGAGMAVDESPRAIADGLLRYLTDDDARASASAHARALVQQEFSVARLGKRLATLYQTIHEARNNAACAYALRSLAHP